MRSFPPRSRASSLGAATTDVAALSLATALLAPAPVHAPIGKASFPTEQLMENMNVLLGALKAKPSAAKGRYLQKITVSATMGPGVDVDLARAQALADKA